MYRLSWKIKNAGCFTAEAVNANRLFRTLCLVWLIFWGTSFALGSEPDAQKIIILVSKNISPYLQAAEGLNRIFAATNRIKTDTILLDKVRGPEIITEKMKNGLYDLKIAVGPEAVRFFRDSCKETFDSIIYTMILDPERTFGQADTASGIPLKIPVGTQIHEISNNLPFAKRLGLLYDPSHNTSFYLKAVEAAGPAGMTVVPLEVFSKKDIPFIVKGSFNRVDALWFIPDRTVISESIIQYIIKEALIKKIPVIGYNRFFYESGAALAFVFDYEGLGSQTARLALQILKGGACLEYVPEFKTRVNLHLIKKLGLDTGRQKNKKSKKPASGGEAAP